MKKIDIEQLMRLIQEAIANETKTDISKISLDGYFGEMGLDSINSIYILHLVEQEIGMELSPLLFYDYPTIRSFCSHLENTIMTGRE